MRPCCGSCAHWVDTRSTSQGKLPYWGKCDAGRPLKAGMYFTRGGYKFRYADFKIRSDSACKDYKEKET